MDTKHNNLDIVQRAINNDTEAFGELCRLYARKVIYLCKRSTQNQQDAEDAAQEVFIQMQKSISTLKAPEAFNVWLARLVTHTCNNVRRKAMKQNGALPIDDFEDMLFDGALDSLPQDYIENETMRESIAAIVDDLPSKYRNCVLLHYYQGLSYDETARALEIAPRAVKHNLNMARKIMKAELEETADMNNWSVGSMVPFGAAMTAIFDKSAEATVSTGTIVKTLNTVGVAYTAAAVTGTAAGVWVGAKKALLATALVASVGLGASAIAYAVDAIINLPPTTSAWSDTSYADVPPDESEVFQIGSDEDESAPPVTAAYVSGRVQIDNSPADPNIPKGLQGLRLDLINADNTEDIIQSTYTKGEEENGEFAFTNVAPGEYSIRLTLPENTKAASIKGARADNESPGIFWLANGETTVFQISGNLSDLDISLLFETAVSGFAQVENGSPDALPSITVSLLDPQMREIGSAAVDEEGKYVFINPPISQSGDHTLRFNIENSVGLDIPYTSDTIQLSPGISLEAQALILRDISAPLLNMQLIGNDCDCGHINPTGVKIEIYDATKTSLKWQIFDYFSNDELANGSSRAQLNEELAMLNNGSYLLKLTVQDAGGNTTNAEEPIEISR